MKKKSVLFILCLLLTQHFFAKSLTITVTNPNQTDQENVPVVILLDKYEKIKPGERAKLAVFSENTEISSQLDDMNGDNIPDELVFLTDIKANETKTFTLKTISDKKRKSFTEEVYADLILKAKDGTFQYVTEASSTKNDMYNALHHHGIAFESSIIAYRIYFDNKSTIDVYGKKKYRLELAETGWYPNDEQLEAGYGDDILRVSGTVGVGTVKGWNGKKALHIDNFDKRTQRIVASGNLRTVNETIVEGWQYEGKKINMTVRYIQYARHRDVAVEVTASDDIDYLATGVQKVGKGSLLTGNDGLVGSWGTDFPVNDTIKYARETCGLGVYVPEKHFKSQVVEKNNNLVLMSYKKGEVLCFYLTAASLKEEEKPFQNESDFFTYLKAWSNTLQPVTTKEK